MKIFQKRRSGIPFYFFIFQTAFCNPPAATTVAFEGRIKAVMTRGGESSTLLYTVSADFLRVESSDSTGPDPVDILDRHTGMLTLLFPHNRSFLRLKPAPENPSTPPGFPPIPAGLPPGIGPTNLPGIPAGPNSPAILAPPAGLTPGIGPQLPRPGAPGTPIAAQPPGPPAIVPPGIGPLNLPGRPAMPNAPAIPSPPAGLPPGIGPQAQAPAVSGIPAIPVIPNAPGTTGVPAMPMMPMPMERMELKATGEKTKLLGFLCEKFEIKQRGETMEIWATDQLPPFQNYMRNQPPRFGPRMIEERWAELLTAKELFPVRASLHFDNGPERFHFEVQSVTPEKLKEEDMKRFQPPDGYFEIEPLPF